MSTQSPMSAMVRGGRLLVTHSGPPQTGGLLTNLDNSCPSMRQETGSLPNGLALQARYPLRPDPNVAHGNESARLHYRFEAEEPIATLEVA